MRICIALAILTFAVFAQTLSHDFVDWDDGLYVFNNPMVAQGLTVHGVAWAFTHFHSFNWHPVTWISHQADCQLFGLHASGHHLTSLLIHIASVISLFLVLRNMTGALWRSAFVAAIFAIHPLHVESVAWIAERKDVLSGFFFILTLWAYVRYVRVRAGLILTQRRKDAETQGPRSGGASACETPIKSYLLTLLLFGCGLMSKPMLVTLPLILLLLDYWPLNRFPVRQDLSPRLCVSASLRFILLEKLPFFALSAASCIITIFAQRGAIQSMETLPLSHRLANACLSYVVYLKQMIWPVKLAPYYPFPPAIPVWKVALAVVLLIGVSVMAWQQRRRQPWLLVGWLWYLVMLVPVIGIVQVGQQMHADRYTYLPQIGICIALTWTVANWFNAKTQRGKDAEKEGVLHSDNRFIPLAPLRLGAFALLVVLMFSAWKQTGYWKNSQTLADRALACTANNYMAHAMLGDVLLREGKPDEAIIQFKSALAIKPDLLEARNNLGNALAREGKLDEAISDFNEVIRINPDYADAHFNLGLALSQKGRAGESIAEFTKVIQINPVHAAAYKYLGDALVNQGKIDEAIVAYRQALAINPGYSQAQQGLERAIIQR